MGDCKSARRVISGKFQYTVRDKRKTKFLTHEEFIHADDWISEVGFWAVWQHSGQLSAVVPCEYIEVDLGVFREVGVTYGNALQKYFGDFAALFICHAEKYGISD